MSKFIDYFNGLTQDTDPQGDSDFIMTYDTSTSGIKKVLITDFGFLTSGLSTDTKLDDLAAPDDNTDLDATASAHGLLMKLSGDSDTYLNGDGEWTTPAGSGGGGFTTGDIHMVELYRGELTTDGNFDVSSISQDYDHLKIIARLRSSVSADYDPCHLYLNNDTTAGNYKMTRFLNADALYAGIEDNATIIYSATAANSTANSFAFAEFFIPNYSSTSYLHHVMGKVITYRGSYFECFYAGYTWEASGGNAISRITIQPDGYATDKFVSGSFLQIIGIKTEA